MPRQFSQSILLYSVALLMLLMQSFALWHDAVHPFHSDHSHGSHHIVEVAGHDHDHHASHHNQQSAHSCHSTESLAYSDPFSELSEQCERFEAFFNLSAIDSVLTSPIITSINAKVNVVSQTADVAVFKYYLADAIRAPPYLLS